MASGKVSQLSDHNLILTHTVGMPRCLLEGVPFCWQHTYLRITAHIVSVQVMRPTCDIIDDLRNLVRSFEAGLEKINNRTFNEQG